MMTNTNASVPTAKCQKTFPVAEVCKRQGVYAPFPGANTRIVTIKHDSFDFCISLYISGTTVEPFAAQAWLGQNFIEMNESISISFFSC